MRAIFCRFRQRATVGWSAAALLLAPALSGCAGAPSGPAETGAEEDGRTQDAAGDAAADHGPRVSMDAQPEGPSWPLCAFEVTADDSALPQWSLHTTSARPDWNVDNPFDPAQVKVEGEFAGPDGSILQSPGFYTVPFVRELVAGAEQLTQDGDPHWQVRFSPPAAGTWKWRWVATVGDNVCATPWTPLHVAPAAPGSHGFLRVASDPRYLAFDDGTPYFPIGENMAWPDARGTFAYDEWMERLAASGGNYVRIWMASWSYALEWVVFGPDGEVADTTLGNYTAHLDRAWQLDQVLRTAEANGISVMLCLLHHGQFSKDVNPAWQDNPYRADFGGPLVSPADFFTNAAARSLFERRLRYIVARWGYATNLLAWELWNEVDYTQQYDAAILAEWHERMAGLLHDLDPNRHLVTTSTSMMGTVLKLDQALFALPEIDLSQFHLYGSGQEIVLELPATIPDLVAGLAQLGKPVLAGEVGVDYRGPAETLEADPDFVGYRDILWLPVLAGSAGIGMHWWWDDLIDPLDLYRYFGPVSTAVFGIDFPAEQPVALDWTVSHGGKTFYAFVLQGGSTALLWIKNQADQYFLAGDDSEVSELALDLAGLPPGTWSVTWLDPSLPTPVGETIWTSGTPLAVPPFRGALAARMVR
jgi:hypothetical protein